MAHDQREQLIKWLNDAYGMEKSMIQTLENHAKDADNHPQLKDRIRQHIEETKRQRDAVQQCIEQLGGDTSGLQNASTGMAPDEPVKNIIMDYAAEHYEIATYKAIQHLAASMGEMEVADMCGRIIPEEEDMARFLDQHLPMAVDAFAQEKLRDSL